MKKIDASVKLKVSESRMRVIGNYIPAYGEGNNLSVDDVMQQLHSLEITTGIRSDSIDTMCESTRLIPSAILAEGEKPQVGEKSRIEMYVDLNKKSKAFEREDGSVDFKDLGEICSAVAGQELYSKIPATIGPPGVNVYGDEVPGLPGRDLKIVLGTGTEIDENDPNLVKAKISGEVQLIKGVLQISDIHHIKSDVSFETGNIKFDGNVKINGSVLSGFKVEAKGNIEVIGNVEDAEIIAGNDVMVKGGYTGAGDGNVIAGRDVYLKFIENQTVKAGRDIFILGDSYHAKLFAGRSLKAKGAKSSIVGGLCETKLSVEASRLGSVANPTTVIKIGIDPELSKRMVSVEEEIEKTIASQEELEKSVIFLYRLKIDNKGTLPPDKAALLEKLESAKKSLPEKLKTLESTQEKLLEEQKELDKVFAISRTCVFPKVQVYIGHQWIGIEDKLGPSHFRLVNGEVVRLSK